MSRLVTRTCDTRGTDTRHPAAYLRRHAPDHVAPAAEQATERAFADSFRVSLTDASKFDVIASSFQGAPGVGKVQDQKQLLDKFFTFMNVVS